MNLLNLDATVPSTGPAEWSGTTPASVAPETGDGAFGLLLADAMRLLPGQDLAAAAGLMSQVSGVEGETSESAETIHPAVSDIEGDGSGAQMAWPRSLPQVAAEVDKSVMSDVPRIEPGLTAAGIPLPSAALAESGAAVSRAVWDAPGLTTASAALLTKVSPSVGLQTQPLGPSMRLITPASAPPDVESLAAFARSQGLDEQATRWLLGLPPGPAAQAGAATAVAGLARAQGRVEQGGTPQTWGLTGVPGAAQPTTPAAVLQAASPSDAEGAAITAVLVPASLQLSGFMGGRGREPMAAPTTNDLPVPASVIAGLRKAVLMPGEPATTRSVPGRPGADAAVPSFVDMPLDLEIDLPEGLQGPDALEDLRAWLDQTLVDGLPDDGSSPLMSTTSAGESASSRVGGLGSAALVDRSATAADDVQLRTEQHRALAQRMGEAMAQRLMAQVERGNWNVRFMLRPQSLGQVEVELQMRAGELDAAFRAPQALTRELLNDSLPRLREVLTQMGMDVANLHVGARQGQSAGGNSTPRQPTQSRSEPARTEALAPVASGVTRPSRSGQDGWDVLV